MSRARTLLLLILVYGAASLLHFVHNAVYIQAYPNLPNWITSPGVYASWCGIAAVGALGYWLFRRISQAIGLFVIGIYALLGFGGLDHYVVATMGAHSIAMNATILAEVLAASVLLIFVVLCGLSARKHVQVP